MKGAAALLFAGALSGALAAGCDSGPPESRYEELSELEIGLAPQKRLVVENARGTVRLRASDTTVVRIDARKRTAARTQEEARALADEIRVELLREGADLRLVVHYPERTSGARVRLLGRDLLRKRANVDLQIAVPRETAVKAVTKSGDLTLEGSVGPIEFWTTSGDARIDGHTGRVTMRSTSGDLSIGRLNGDLEMNTTSGDLRADLVTGTLGYEATSGDLSAEEVGSDLVASTVSGDVEVGRVRGVTTVSTTSGDVSLTGVAGRLGIATGSGDVDAGIEEPLQRVSVETTSGDVALTLPDPPRGRLEVVTASGEMTARLPMSLEQATRRRLVGVLGPGPATIAIQTASGDVRVTVAGDRDR